MPQQIHGTSNLKIIKPRIPCVVKYDDMKKCYISYVEQTSPWSQLFLMINNYPFWECFCYIYLSASSKLIIPAVKEIVARITMMIIFEMLQIRGKFWSSSSPNFNCLVLEILLSQIPVTMGGSTLSSLHTIHLTKLTEI